MQEVVQLLCQQNLIACMQARIIAGDWLYMIRLPGIDLSGSGAVNVLYHL
jgi:hypothetical protein